MQGPDFPLPQKSSCIYFVTVVGPAICRQAALNHTARRLCRRGAGLLMARRYDWQGVVLSGET
jgi:hypothetical protein